MSYYTHPDRQIPPHQPQGNYGPAPTRQDELRVYGRPSHDQPQQQQSGPSSAGGYGGEQYRRADEYRRDSYDSGRPGRDSRGGSNGGGGRRERSASPERYRDRYDERDRRDDGYDGGRGRDGGRGGMQDRNPYSSSDRPRRPRTPPPEPQWRGEAGTSRSLRGTDQSELIASRLRKERPVRTLFVRNISFETPVTLVSEKFDRMGDVKSFFDLIPKRGMVFITYFDIRAAILAKDALQDADVNGRRMDVHYSIPRDVDLAKRCERDKNQASILVSVPDSRSSMNDEDLRAAFGKYGDIKSIGPADKSRSTSTSDRVVEFFDSRGCENAMDHLKGAPMAGGSLKLELVWDAIPPAPPATPPQPRPLPGPPRGQDYRNEPRSSPSPSSFALPDARAELERYNQPPPPPPIPSVNDRLDAARKVQDLLASLSAPPPLQPSYNAPPPSYPTPDDRQPPQQSYAPYAPPPSQYPQSPQYPSQQPVGIPPAIAALLAQSSTPQSDPYRPLQQQSFTPPPQSFQTPPPPPSGFRLPPGSNNAPPTGFVPPPGQSYQPASVGYQPQPPTLAAAEPSGQVQALLALLARQAQSGVGR